MWILQKGISVVVVAAAAESSLLKLQSFDQLNVTIPINFFQPRSMASDCLWWQLDRFEACLFCVLPFEKPQ